MEFKYCTGCGSPIEDLVRLRFCPYCGCKDEGKKFCAECGASLADIPTSVQPQHPAATMAVQAAMTVQPTTTAAQPMMTPQPSVTPQPGMATPEAGQQWQGQPSTARLAKAYCPDCGNEATWVTQYNQWYCYVDQKYVATPSYSEPKKGGLFRKH